jgi:hypothetical protein
LASFGVELLDAHAALPFSASLPLSWKS